MIKVNASIFFCLLYFLRALLICQSVLRSSIEITRLAVPDSEYPKLSDRSELPLDVFPLAYLRLGSSSLYLPHLFYGYQERDAQGYSRKADRSGDILFLLRGFLSYCALSKPYDSICRICAGSRIFRIHPTLFRQSSPSKHHRRLTCQLLTKNAFHLLMYNWGACRNLPFAANLRSVSTDAEAFVYTNYNMKAKMSA